MSTFCDSNSLRLIERVPIGRLFIVLSDFVLEKLKFTGAGKIVYCDEGVLVYSFLLLLLFDVFF